jgi:hypothetical protein
LAVEKVEVSLDGGASWCPAAAVTSETPTKKGKSWCWVLWSLAVSHAQLAAAASVKCRATAAGGATQQAGLAWNAQGVCNNAIFTVKVLRSTLLGVAKSSLGVAESSLGVAESSLGDAKSSLGVSESWRGG